MLSFLTLRKLIIPFLVVLALAGAVYGIYTAGGASERANQLEEQLDRIESITDAIKEGRREVREANPNNDAAVARERLRLRQESR